MISISKLKITYILLVIEKLTKADREKILYVVYSYNYGKIFFTNSHNIKLEIVHLPTLI